jgi:hypothetical protein
MPPIETSPTVRDSAIPVAQRRPGELSVDPRNTVVPVGRPPGSGARFLFPDQYFCVALADTGAGSGSWI